MPTTTCLSGFLRMEVVTEIESSSPVLKFRINNKSLGII
jgi:hypothetical protein